MDLYLRLLRYVKPYWKKLVLAMVFMSLVSAANGATAFLVKPVLDKIFFEKNESMLIVLPFAIVLLYLLKGIFDYFQAYLMGYVGQKVVTDVRNLVFQALQRQPLSFFDRTPTGSSISRVINDVNLIQNTVSDTLTALLKDSLTIIFLVFVVIYRDWKLAIISFIVLPFAMYPIVSFGRRLRRVSVKVQRSVAKLTSFLHENITGQRIVKAFCMEPLEERRFERENDELFKTVMKRLKIRALSSPIVETLAGIGVAFIIWYGGSEVISGRSTPGNFFSFMAALLMLYEPIKRLNKENHNIQQGLAATQRIFELLDREPEIKEKEGAIELRDVKGNIEFLDVSFKYEDRYILKNVSLKIREGEVVAIVGESGVGKTTLVNLIPRFYDVTSGSLRIDGIDVRDVTLKSLRENIAIVTQEVILFNDSILNNITFGREVDPEKVEWALRMAYADEIVRRLPNGVHTSVGEKGVRLSGGEKQRIAIARAIYKDARILILDEATSSLDYQSELKVRKAIENLIIGRTTIIVAHRLSTIMGAQRIIVLERGQIAQDGTHGELMEMEGPYRRLFEAQLKREKKKVISLPLAKKDG